MQQSLANRPWLRTLPPPHSYGNQRLQRQFDGLLMMGIVMPETCWAVSVQQRNKFYDWFLHLVGCFYLSDSRCTEPQTLKKSVIECFNCFNMWHIQCINYILKCINNHQKHFNFIIHNVFTSMLQPAVQPSSGWWYKNKIIVKCAVSIPAWSINYGQVQADEVSFNTVSDTVLATYKTTGNVLSVGLDFISILILQWISVPFL